MRISKNETNNVLLHTHIYMYIYMCVCAYIYMHCICICLWPIHPSIRTYTCMWHNDWDRAIRERIILGPQCFRKRPPKRTSFASIIKHL